MTPEELNKAKVGDKITIEMTVFKAHSDGNILLEGLNNGVYLNIRGMAQYVTKIETPAFDWATVKHGMAFYLYFSEGVKYYYIGKSLNNKDKVIFKVDGSYVERDKIAYIRAPEHDIKKDDTK